MTDSQWKMDGDLAEHRDRITVLEVKLAQTRFALVIVVCVFAVLWLALLLMVLGDA